MKKRLFAMLLVLALSVSMLTVCAFAATPTIDLERRESDSGDNWFWNGKTQTLILQGGTIDAEDGIYIDCDATIKVEDDTEIDGFIVVDGELIIEGDETLRVSSATAETAITVEDDMFLDEAHLMIAYADNGIDCNGTFTAEDSTVSGVFLDAFIIADEVEIYDSTVGALCGDFAIFAHDNVSIEWSEINASTNGPVICAGNDVVIEACEIAIVSSDTSAIWADGRIRIRDCDLEDDVYVDDLDDVLHPYYGSVVDVNALFYEDDDEAACGLYGETAISAYSDVVLFIGEKDAGEPGEYNDVSRYDWFADAVEYVSAKGLMIGTGRKTFSPNETVSNAMAWMILARINDAYTMSEGNWYDAAQSFVVTCGLSDGANPDGAITREAFITMLFKSNGSYCVRDLSVFADASSVSASAVEPMRWAVENGIIKGVDGKLNPKGYMTRAELAEILMRLG